MSASTPTGTRLRTSASPSCAPKPAATPTTGSLHDLVGELSTRSDEFRTRWGRHDVRHHGTGTKRFHHPVVGELTLAYEGLDMAAEPGLTLTIYTAEPGSPSEDRLRLLGSWAATHAADTAPAATVSRRDSRPADDERLRHRVDHRPRPRRRRQALLADGHHVIVHARNDERATALEPLRAAGADVVIGDLANLDETNRIADDVNELGSLDAVIHNAGIYTDTEPNRTVDGHPRVFAVNVLAPYLLTARIRRPARLIYLSSGMHTSGRTALDDLDWRPADGTAPRPTATASSSSPPSPPPSPATGPTCTATSSTPAGSPPAWAARRHRRPRPRPRHPGLARHQRRPRSQPSPAPTGTTDSPAAAPRRARPRLPRPTPRTHSPTSPAPRSSP